jgi:uncharacterized protein
MIQAKLQSRFAMPRLQKRTKFPMLIHDNHQQQNLVLGWVAEDAWMMDVLRAAATLQLPDWCISAGFVRSKVWDMLHECPARTPLADVDVVYYNPSNLDEQTEKQLESQLRQLMQGVPWSVKNQARMHIPKGEAQYASTADALAKYPETCTAVGLRIERDGTLTLLAPLGLDDLLNRTVRPTAHFVEHAGEQAAFYNRRVDGKNWISKWPRLRVFELAPDGVTALKGE